MFVQRFEFILLKIKFELVKNNFNYDHIPYNFNNTHLICIPMSVRKKNGDHYGIFMLHCEKKKTIVILLLLYIRYTKLFK